MELSKEDVERFYEMNDYLIVHGKRYIDYIKECRRGYEADNT